MNGRTLALLVLGSAALWGTPARAQSTPTASPYAGEERQAIKALAPAEVEQYLAGAGMGLARAAELNHYPGPRHVLDLADSLGLTATQRADVRALFEAMQSEARRLGREVVARERALDSLFAAGHIDEPALAAALDGIARVQGELRFVHLRAHLHTKALLRPAQVQRYDQLRGYGASDAAGAAHPASHHHGH